MGTTEKNKDTDSDVDPVGGVCGVPRSNST